MVDIMQLRQFARKKPCYYCGAPGPSNKEHAPPEMMFKGFQCDSITVPACDTHNTQKNIGDRAIITAISMSAFQEWKRNPTNARLTPNIVKSIGFLEQDFQQAKNEVALREFLRDPLSDFDSHLPYIQPGLGIKGWIRQLTAALVWSVVGKHDPGINWDKTWAWSPGFIFQSQPQPRNIEEAGLIFLKNQAIEDKLNNNFIWQNGWSSIPRRYPPDIYSFKVAFIEDPKSLDGMEVIFKHQFYNLISVWYALFPTSPETKRCLLKAVS